MKYTKWFKKLAIII